MPNQNLTTNELAYLLSLVSASGIAGLAPDGVLNGANNADDAREAGLAGLKAKGLLVPGERRDTWSLDDILILAVAAVADPQYVVRTATEDGDDGRAVYHYLAPGLVVELTCPQVDVYQLAIVQDDATLAARSAQLLSGEHPPVTTPPAPLPPKTGEFMVAQAKGAALGSGRRATVHGGAWLAHKQTADAPSPVVTALTAASLHTLLKEFLATLAGK